MKPHRPFARSVVLVSILSFLNACSGGGGNADDSGGGNAGGGNSGGTTPATAPAAPTLALNPTAVKAFRFTWTDVSGETEYRLLEDATGSAGYTPVATPSADATSHDLIVPLPKRVNARYILQACNAQGCTDSASVSVSGGLVAAIGYVKASNTGLGDSFGASVALSADGNTLAVGATWEDGNATGINSYQNDGAANAGAVYVFARSSSGTRWAQEAYIKASNTGVIDYFGSSVALSGDGNTLAVGAYGEDSGATGINGNHADNSAVDEAGAVYVFTRNQTVWTNQAYIKASNTEAFDRFGFSVALSGDGNTLAVGAYGEDSNNTLGVGAVYAFTRSGTTWEETAYIKPSNPGRNNFFGFSIALSGDGNTLAVGAYGEASSTTGINGIPDENAANAGAVYVFARRDRAWAQQGLCQGLEHGA